MEITRVGVKFWYVIKYFQIQCWFCQLLAIYKYIEFFFKCNLFSTLSYFNQRQVSALTMLTNVIKYISITLVLFLFMFDCLLFRSYIPYFCPRVCEGSHLHKIIIDLDQILVIEDRLIDKIHPITLKSVINYTQLQFLFPIIPSLKITLFDKMF